MREVLDDLVRWWSAGAAVGVVTVVRTDGSAPRAAGATMLVGPDGTVVGSISGGCVEAAAHELAVAVRDGAAPVRQEFDGDGGLVGVSLTCGGSLEVFAQRSSRGDFPDLPLLADHVAAARPVALATVVQGPAERIGTHLVVLPTGAPSGGTGSSRLDDAVVDDARGLLAAGRTGVLEYGPDGRRRGAGLRVLVQVFAPAPRMLVFGATDHAAAVARLGTFLGYRVSVCDARPAFATDRRFPEAAEVVVDWPHRWFDAQVDAGLVGPDTVVCVLTHDPKFDVPLLQRALRRPLAFVGAMGSRKTAADRREQLALAGVPPAELDRLSSPTGLDLGGRTPQETAVSIAAEIVARRWAGSGRPLTEIDAPVHARTGGDGA